MECLHYQPQSHFLLAKTEVPYVFVADDAFALKEHLMKPYPHSGLTEDKRIYNYRHSRARRISENCFGITASRWRVFRTAIVLPPDTIKVVVLAALALHNFLRKSASRGLYYPTGLIDYEDSCGNIVLGSWRLSAPTGSMFSLQRRTTGDNPCKNAKEIREIFNEFFCSEGAVPWQWDK